MSSNEFCSLVGSAQFHLIECLFGENMLDRVSYLVSWSTHYRLEDPCSCFTNLEIVSRVLFFVINILTIAENKLLEYIRACVFDLFL